MLFKYSCFVSYRAGKTGISKAIINDLCEALSKELDLWLEQEVYVDDARLKGGDFFNQELATALCQSVCMIFVFTPRYFDKTETYCAQEYKTMERIEEQRLRLLPGNKKHGLIIPIIIRGEKRLPTKIKKKRKYYNFQALEKKRKITWPRGYSEAVKEIAEYIADRYLELSALKVDPCDPCTTFEFLSVEEVTTWLDELLGT